MKKTDPRWNDVRAIRGSGNVFVDLGFDKAEAKVLALRAELMIKLTERLKTKGWSQVEAARRLQVSQPRISKLTKGLWRDFSLDMLLTLAVRAGLRTELSVS